MQIELIKPHTHAGRLCQPGEVIDLDPAAARWLIDIGVARPLDRPGKPTTKQPTRKGD